MIFLSMALTASINCNNISIGNNNHVYKFKERETRKNFSQCKTQKFIGGKIYEQCRT